LELETLAAIHSLGFVRGVRMNGLLDADRYHLCRINNDKRPIDSGWRRLSQAEVDKHIGAGGRVGLVLANSDVAVIDVDMDKQHGGINQATISKLLAMDLPEGPTIKSPSGGYHQFFKTTGKKPARQIRPFGEGITIDLLGGGGYVALYPDQNGSYEQYNFESLPEFPENLIHERQAANDPQSVTSGHNLLDDDLKQTRAMLGFLNPESYDLWIKVGMALYDRGDGSDQMFRAWNNWSQWSDKHQPGEMRRKWNSFASNCPDKINEQTLDYLARKAGYADPPSGLILNSVGWPMQSLEDIKKLDLPPREPVIGPFMSAAVTIVAAERGTGKTMWMTELGQSVASGESFCDWDCRNQGKVAFMQFDMPIQAVQKRAMRRTWHPNFHYVTRWHFQRADLPIPDLGNPQHHAAIVQQLAEYRMVIFDTRRAAQPPGQGAAANLWHPSYWLASAPVRHQLADLGVAIVLLDHLNAAGEVKDTKAIEDDADAVIALRDSDKGTHDLCFQVEMSKDRDNVGSVSYFEFGDSGWRQFTEQAPEREVLEYRATEGSTRHCGGSVRNASQRIRILCTSALHANR
jgi:hypothetical protein